MFLNSSFSSSGKGKESQDPWEGYSELCYLVYWEEYGWGERKSELPPTFRLLQKW